MPEGSAQGNNDVLSGEYNAINISVLEGPEAVRKRPGMYIGNVQDGTGLHQLVWELLANAIDQHLSGRCSLVSIQLHPDGSFTVEDDGPGIPVEPAGEGERSLLEEACTSLHHRATLDGHTPHVHVSMNGVGLAAVSALGSRFLVETVRDGNLYRLCCERGSLVAGPTCLGPTDRRGTRATVAPDPSIFASVALDAEAIAAKLREVSFLNPSLELRLVDGRAQTFLSPAGLADMIPVLRGDATPLHEVLATSTTVGDVKVTLALQWCTGRGGDVAGFANMTRTREGGTHVQGLWKGVAMLVLELVGKPRRPTAALGARLREGLYAAVAVEHHDPSFDSPTKSLVVSPDAGVAAATAIEQLLRPALRADPALERHLLGLAFGTRG
jgi:DNA gyrase subunit B